jgi:hypothetical protein
MASMVIFRCISLVKDPPVLRPIQRLDQIAARPIFDIKQECILSMPSIMEFACRRASTVPTSREALKKKFEWNDPDQRPPHAKQR